MKRGLIALVVLAVVLTAAAAGCGSSSDVAGVREEFVYQVSVLSAIKAGEYDGDVPVSTLTEKGDFGHGTFEGLEGEMVVLDGEIWRIGTDGKPVIADASAITPYATVTEFQPEIKVTTGRRATLDDLQSLIDSKLPTPNLFYAIKAHCKLSTIQVRSVPKQSKPYKPLAEALKGQVVFDLKDVEGTLVAWRYPDFARDLGQAPYHWHFITDDRKAGGHVLSLAVDSGSMEIDKDYRLEMALPAVEEFNKCTPLLASPSSAPASSPQNP